jgi:hypothetical protein
VKASLLDSTNTQAEGLRALCTPSEVLSDLCHHSLYEIYVKGQYVESVGNLRRNAQRALEFWRRKRRKQTVEVRVQPCRVPGCIWGQS